jgi:hypothetical protein
LYWWERGGVTQETIIIVMQRDAAHYLSMLLGDQLLTLGDGTVPMQLEPLRSAYEHVRDVVEQALVSAPLVA